MNRREDRLEDPCARAVAAAVCHSSILRWVTAMRTIVTPIAWII
jgi:hypothetical protein